MTPDRGPGSSVTGLDRPLLIIGTPKAGRSVVASLLGRSCEFHYLVEPLMIWDIGLGKRADDRRFAEEATNSVRDQINRACRQSVSRAGKQRYLDDLAYHSLRIPFVHAVHPDTKFIHVIRPPREVIPEMIWGWVYRDTLAGVVARRWRNVKLRTLPRLAGRFASNYVRMRVRGRRATWGPRVPGLADFSASHSVAEVAAYQWREMIEIAREDLRRLPADRWIEVRFDRLVVDPRAEFAHIASFAQLGDPGPTVDYAAQQLDPDYVYDKKVQPTAAEWAAIDKLTESLQRELGYWEGDEESPR